MQGVIYSDKEKKQKDGERTLKSMKKSIKLFVMVVMLALSMGLFTGCVKEDYGYFFHFYVDEDNGAIKIETTSSFNPRVQLCSDDKNLHELECVDGSQYTMLLGGKDGYRELTFIATPNEGYQVKEWIFNGQIIDGNKTNSYKAKVSYEHNYHGVIAVRFEPI